MMWRWSELKALLKKKEYSNNDYIAVMWPVAYPSGYPAPVDPHCTVIILGTTDTVNFTKEEVLEVIRNQRQHNSFLFTKVKELTWFGPDADVPVLLLDHTVLEEFQSNLKRDLAAVGIQDASSYPEYRPHCTITENAARTRNFPDRLMLTPVQLWWGTEKISA
jgi:2'-5' RNA ligase